MRAASDPGGNRSASARQHQTGGAPSQLTHTNTPPPALRAFAAPLCRKSPDDAESARRNTMSTAIPTAGHRTPKQQDRPTAERVPSNRPYADRRRRRLSLLVGAAAYVARRAHAEIGDVHKRVLSAFDQDPKQVDRGEAWVLIVAGT